jgi:hypothetical protein
MAISKKSLPDPSIPENILFFKDTYQECQEYGNLRTLEDDYFFICFCVHDSSAVSLPKSLFGSVFSKRNYTLVDLKNFISRLKITLQKEGVTKLELIHPSNIYQSVTFEELIKVGFTNQWKDINQHIALTLDWPSMIHKMEKRKLQKLNRDGYRFSEMDYTRLKESYDFIRKRRDEQGLVINIAFERLQKLYERTHSYQLFGVFFEAELVSTCICVQITSSIAYYYLPATHPDYKKDSPMVLLIHGLVDHYRSKGFTILDMGVSSKEGSVQKSLHAFKERMGAVSTDKPRLSLTIYDE